MLFIIFLLLSSSIYLTHSEEVVVTIPNGQMRGKSVSSRNITFYAFEQIPYGKAPVGELRFQAPEPAESWEGILDATENRKVCYQHDNANHVNNLEELETEDCLILNVFTPKKPDVNENLPVMFYIHGGGFISGFSLLNWTGPHYLMEQDVIVVTINYRVGPFGFLATNDSVVPGNAGLKDQVLALKWVQENIKYFGGDPEKVTIFGHSAGAASVTYHLVSKQSEGLFRGAIALSGSLFCPWAYQRYHREFAYRLAGSADPTFNYNSTSEELLTFLQNLPAERLKQAHVEFNNIFLFEPLVQGYWFAPVIEPEHENAFLTETQFSVISEGRANKVPLLIGISSEEMIWKAANLTELEEGMYRYDRNLMYLVNENMKIKDQFVKYIAASYIKNIYASPETSLVEDSTASVRYFSDMSFTRSIIHHANLQSEFSNVYFYQFSYHGELGQNHVEELPGAERVGHGEILKYLWAFDNNPNLADYPPEDILTSNRFRTVLTNFAKTLNPTPEESELLSGITWPNVEPNNFQYLNINDSLSIEVDPKKGTYHPWVEIYETYGVKPHDTF